MKTAIQELIEFIDDKFTVSNSPQISSIYYKAQELLEEEKQQIIDACWYGHDIKHEYFNPIHYIDKTYPQNK
jgi:hypothetical protein